MKLNKTKVRYILRQNRKGVATEEIAQDVKVSQRRVQQIIKEYKETGQEPVLGEKVGRPAKAFDEKEAEAVREAHACYRLGARMLSASTVFLQYISIGMNGMALGSKSVWSWMMHPEWC